MHESRYNIIVEDGGSYLAYNTANAAFALLDAQGWETLKTGEGPCANDLASWGFLTELTAEQELAQQQERFDRTRADLSKLVLSLIPTYACNYRCPYCYEIGHNDTKGKMDAAAEQAILDFVQNRYDAYPFTELIVEWYGGDPSLALDVVESVSGQLIAWCGQRKVNYQAMMLSNANLIGEKEAELLARCQVKTVHLTIDGPEEVHNARRVAADGSNSYERNIQAARALRANGIEVRATMNVDKVTWPLYRTFRDELLAEEGIMLNAAKLCDYGHFYGTEPFAAPAFDLFTHEEFAQVQLEQFIQEPHTAAEMREMLRPIRRFCTGQLDNYYIIDLLGNVYNCDGWVGDHSYVRFNLHDDCATWKLSDVSHDATRVGQCSACVLLPVCQGNCNWERACNGWPCHPFKYTIEGYLRAYRRCFDDVPEGAAVLLAAPYEQAELEVL